MWLLSPHLGEIADNVASLCVVLAHDVEEEGVSIVVESLVIQEQLEHKAEI